MTNDSLPPAEAPALKLHCDARGQLQQLLNDGSEESLTPVRAFALSAPDAGISLVGPDGRERHWIPDLQALAPELRALITQALATRDFAPVLLQLRSVSTFGVPSTWHVRTDRGDTQFVLKAEEDIRRLEDGALLITSAHGLQLRVPNRQALDRPSRRLLERFL